MVFKGVGFDAISRRLAPTSTAPSVPAPVAPQPLSSTPTGAATSASVPTDLSPSGGNMDRYNDPAFSNNGLVLQPNGTYVPSDPANQPQADYANSGLAYDPEYTQVMQQIARKRGLAQSHLAEDKQHMQSGVYEQQRSMEQQHPIDLENIRNNYAGRGLLRSGGTIRDTVNEETNYANRVTGLQRTLTDALNSYDRQFNDQNQGWQDEETSALQDAIRRRAAQIAANNAAGQAAAVANGAYQNPQQSPVTTVPNVGPLDSNIRQPVGTSTNPANAAKENTEPLQPQAPQPQPANQAPLPQPQAAFTVQPTRPLSSFDPQSQRNLQSGSVVISGSGFAYVLKNGIPTRIS